MHIRVHLPTQTLTVFRGEDVATTYAISSAEKGVGCMTNSHQTPIGKHEIAECIGKDAPFNSVFVSRKPTGEIYDPYLAAQYPARDWILTRILWLRGLEPGINAGGDVDTYQRYIYIHGCPDECPMGRPMSHGCIRMHNEDVVDLFDRVTVGTPVNIEGVS